MRTLQQWLDEYGESHRNAVNEQLHRICVPLIVLSVAGFLWSLPVPQAFETISPWLNWATIVGALAIGYYMALSLPLALGATVVFAAMFALLRAGELRDVPLWQTCAIVFVIAWIGQFIGHAAEGKRPSFFKDVQFLLIGPIWLLAGLYRRVGVSY